MKKLPKEKFPLRKNTHRPKCFVEFSTNFFCSIDSATYTQYSITNELVQSYMAIHIILFTNHNVIPFVVRAKIGVDYLYLKSYILVRALQLTLKCISTKYTQEPPLPVKKEPPLKKKLPTLVASLKTTNDGNPCSFYTVSCITSLYRSRQRELHRCLLSA